MMRFSSSKKLLWLAAILILISASLIFICYLAKDKTELKLYRIQKSDIEQRITVSGTIISERQVIVTPPYDGYIKKLYVKVGQKVNTNDPLLTVVESLQIDEQVYPIRAPYAGTVALVKKTEGEFVRKADANNFIMEIDDLSNIYVNADIPEINIDKIKIGMPVEIKATAILNKMYHGKVSLLSLAPKPAMISYGNVQVVYPTKIIINDPNEQLKPGMSVIVDIIADQRKDVLTLPHEYIHQEGRNYFVLMQDGKKQIVKLGLQNAQAVEILQGLQIGDQVRAVDYAVSDTDS